MGWKDKVVKLKPKTSLLMMMPWYKRRLDELKNEVSGSGVTNRHVVLRGSGVTNRHVVLGGSGVTNQHVVLGDRVSRTDTWY